ncbi:uncharacterized protein LOC116429480 [Nomia melanderi]|uniref:uncharacterized protein LOC116429480 n=1 Tax=Nomia melanderi TaxID=2448451 RepID=UPI001304095D|nr:uncharacterized protein LOC116429480 [Nomia melanderi]
MRRVQQIIRVALFAATLLTALEASIADPRIPLTCKNIARDVIMNSCKGGSKTRRSLDLNDMEKPLPIDASELPQDEPHATQKKRQWGLGQLLPGMGMEMANNYHDTELHTPLLDFQDNQGSDFIQEQFGPEFGPGGFLQRPYGSLGPYRMARSSLNSNKLLGYQLTPEELEELHVEIGERMPRNSKEVNKKIFLNVAAKCCPDAKVCYENPSVVPCGGYSIVS